MPGVTAPRRDGVLVTRPDSGGTATATRIEALGWRPVLAPFLRVVRLESRIPLGAQAVLVASANALPSLPVTGLPLFAVGDATAEAARRLGHADVQSAGRDAEALTALTLRLADPAQGPLVLACGRGQGWALRESLRRQGFRVVRRVFYHAVPVASFPATASEALLSGSLHGAIFLSAETAAAFARLLPAALHPALLAVRAVAIGKPAADALDALQWRDLRLACTPTLDGVLTQL